MSLLVLTLRGVPRWLFVEGGSFSLLLFSVCVPLKAPDFLAKKLRKGTILRPDECDIQKLIEIRRPSERESGIE